jgi:hypothetical protein
MGLGSVPDKEFEALGRAMQQVPKNVKLYTRRLVMPENLSHEQLIKIGRFLTALGRVQKHLPRSRIRQH